MYYSGGIIFDSSIFTSYHDSSDSMSVQDALQIQSSILVALSMTVQY